MPMMTKPSFGPRVAIAYITTGALMGVWVAVWYFFFTRYESESPRYELFLLTGLFLTGLTLVVIGLFLGHIGQQARRAEMPPPEAEKEEARIQQTAAATPHPVAPVGAAPMMAGTPVAPGAAVINPMMPASAATPAAPAPAAGATQPRH